MSPSHVMEPLLEFGEVMRRLRAECGWKRGQTHRSLSRYLLEETHEALEAIDSGDVDHLREELGDLLLQVYFHAVIAEESGDFTLDDVASDIVAKMRRRNPHVFGFPAGEAGRGAEHPAAAAARAGDPASINEVWEAIKAQDRPRTSPLEGIPPGLPALLLADKVLDRLAREAGAGAERPDEEALDEEALGEALLALASRARRAHLDPEAALRAAVRRRVMARPAR